MPEKKDSHYLCDTHNPKPGRNKEKHREKEMISTNGVNIDFKSLQLEKKDMFIL
jgi:hypothetical protein